MEGDPIMQRTIEQIVEKRASGATVGSPADLYKSLGGKDQGSIDVLQRAFGTDFDARMDEGYRALRQRVTNAMRELSAERSGKPASPRPTA